MDVRHGKSPASRGGETGFTLIEVIASLSIAAITLAAFFNTFAFGSVQVEDLGRRRQALGILDGEMEYWRARFRNLEVAQPVEPDEADLRRRAVKVDESRNMVYRVEPEISPLLREGKLHYQAVSVRVLWQRPDSDEDTVSMESRMYAR